ncbi:aspartyl protease family protein At5g10770-like [Mercurialis annua]|uniref:aspartyl protease family protein At5g10770-like n=1 Tax=Mercurialis annua TaxID=3986 RepID=UPI00215E331B|nr:aspartyl protease family protein At5g10770-like [Mercurialis annua]
MELVWFLNFFIILAASSFAKLEEHKLSVNQSSIQLSLFHVHGAGSPLSTNSSVSLYDILSRDEIHVKSIRSRLEKKGVEGASVSRHKSGHLLEPNLANIPLTPGLSIGSGNYYVKLGLGSPPKYYSMIIDTGSSLSWLQCKPCFVYCHTQVDPLFEPSASKTYKTLSCSTSECSLVKAATLNDPLCTASGACVYTASYGDSSYSMGYLSQDVLSLTPSQTLPRFTYGCGQDNEGLFGRAAGIIGLARDKLSMLGQLSLKYEYAFSYCLPTATSTSSGGFLSIGKISPSSYKFTPMIKNPQNPSLYLLRLAAITVAGRPLGVAAGGYQAPTIIDSGTVITRLPISIYTPLKQAFVKIMSRTHAQAPAYSILDACFKGSLKSMSAATPAIRLVFQGGADLSLEGPNILIEVDNGVTCLAFTSSNRIAIIGNHQQQTYNIAYDVSASTIGFAPGGCR